VEDLAPNPSATAPPVEDWQLRPMRCVRPFKTTDPRTGYFFDLQPGQVIAGAGLRRVQELGGGSCLAVMSDAELKTSARESTRFSDQHGTPAPKRIVPEKPAPLLPGANPDEVARAIRIHPELLDRMRERARAAYQASRDYRNHEAMDRMWMRFVAQAKGGDWTTQFNLWVYAEAWFFDRIGK
jgi:hypothetical protein